MFFPKAKFLKGAIQSAESIRRSQAGSITMACFIDTASGYWQNIPARLETLSTLNDILKGLLIPMAITAPWCVPAFQDLVAGHD